MLEVTLGKSWNGKSLGALDFSYLLYVSNDGDREQCCVGVLCSQVGVPDDKLVGKSVLEDVEPGLTDLLPFRVDRMNWDVYSANDNIAQPGFKSISQKLSAINEIMNPLGVNFTYDKNAP